MRTAIAFDRSARHRDADGRLHVANCRISAARVNEYVGKEIPNYEQLGLKADKLYPLYRDPEELKRAAPTFNNVPLLLDHVPVSVDDPALELICGAISNVRYEHPYLIGDLAVWSREAIDAIESGERKELSAAYRYVLDMSPRGSGVHRSGQRFIGTMRNLAANHVALVAEGRAGPDVVVADRKPSHVTVTDMWPTLRGIRCS